MATVAELYALARRNLEAGNLLATEQLCRQVLQTDPNHADSHLLLGVVDYQLGRFESAMISMRRAIGLNPRVAEYHCNLGLACMNLGQRDEAIVCYRRALLLQPDIPEVQFNLGNALVERGQFDEAVTHYEHAIRLNPNYSKAHCNLGVALANLGRAEDAIAHWREALRLQPNDPETHNNLGNVLLIRGHVEESIWHCQQALQYRPNFAEAHNNLANALVSADKPAEAVGHCRTALSLQPNFPEAYYNLGIAFRNQGLLDEAVDCFQRAISARPDFAPAHNNLGDVYLKVGAPEQALSSFRQALQSQPSLQEAKRNLLFFGNYDPGADLDQVFEEHCRWGDARGQGSGVRGQEEVVFPNTPDYDRRLRIGYVSPDFRAHALSRYMEPVLANHDAQQFEVFCYAEVFLPDAVTTRLQGMVHGWRSTCYQTDAEVAQQIRSDRIDILVDLAGHTGHSRLDVFALKPAPVQATWLGYLNTTGLKTVDYRLTDEVLDPPGEPKRDTEELFRLPRGMCCFAPPENAPPVAPLPALRNRHLTFGSVHNLFKINTKVYDLWSQLLSALPSARLLMFRDSMTRGAQERIRQEFRKRGIEKDRLDLRQGPASPGYLKIYDDIDIGLDTFPCTGGVTTCESLWMGVPVLSLRGRRPCGRNSASLLTRVGLSDWAVDSPEEYIAVAVRQAGEVNRLAALRTSLRDMMLSTICEAKQFTRGLEDAYRTMWRRWCASQNAK